MTEPLIQTSNLCFRYNMETDWIIRHLDMSVYAGEWLSVVGHNGSGKSTLAKLLNGLLMPEEGSVHIEGYDTAEASALWEVRRRVGIVFQNPDNQFVGTTVRDDIAFGMENHGIPRQTMLERMTETTEKVGMSAYLQHEPHRLSGGQKQRVAIAGILAVRPSIIILDEATSMLDPKGRQEVLQTVRELNQKEQVTVIAITHDLSETLFADRLMVMNEGTLALSGTPNDIFQYGSYLERIGLDLPFSIKLREALLGEQIPVSQQALTTKELVDDLWTLQSNH